MLTNRKESVIIYKHSLSGTSDKGMRRVGTERMAYQIVRLGLGWQPRKPTGKNLKKVKKRVLTNESECDILIKSLVKRRRDKNRIFEN